MKISHEPPKNPGIRLIGALACLILVVLIALDQNWGSSPPQQSEAELIVYAFSTQEEVFSQGIFPAFSRYWKSTQGSDLHISGIFGPSGTLAGQISLGAPADVAILSNVNQLNYLIISRSIKRHAQPVFYGSSPIVIVTRSGNPAGITGYEDLARSGLVVVHGDPRTSGVGEWSLLAEYGSCLRRTGDQAAALECTEQIWGNVRYLAPSARSALALFMVGAGDALVTYEQDALQALDRGIVLEIITPSQTIYSEPVAVAVDTNITRSEEPVVDAFLAFLTSQEGQQIFTRYHLQSGIPGNPGAFPPSGALTASDLGGWQTTYSQFLKPYWEEYIYPELSLSEGSIQSTPEQDR